MHDRYISQALSRIIGDRIEAPTEEQTEEAECMAAMGEECPGTLGALAARMRIARGDE